MAVVSGDAARVTGGDMRVRVESEGETLQPEVRVLANGTELAENVTLEDRGDGLSGVISGLPLGDNRVVVEATTTDGEALSAAVDVVNHPITGPVFSGPHLTPFECRTVESDLGMPLDADCSVETRVDYFYFNQDGDRQLLADPYGPRPDDMAMVTTLSGDTVPYIVRVESGTINRSIYRIAVLEDPQTEGGWNDSSWNGRLVFRLGESTAAQYNQGDNDFGDVFDDGASFRAITEGYGYIVSTLNINKVNVNDVVAAETMMMVKERFIETYGVPLWMVGLGGSGGAIQQILITQNYPGLMDGILPGAAFPGVFGTALAVSDCRLLNRYFTANPAGDSVRQAFEGHLPGTCRNWDFGNGDAIVATDGSASPVCGLQQAGLVYDPVTNPDGVRCSLYDININTLGIDPETGFVRRPLDNVGVQYGLEALRAGTITVDEFLDVNEGVGGFDVDGNLAPARTEANLKALELAYGRGRVGSGGGGLAVTPIFHRRFYAEPAGDIHTIYNDIQIREKLIRENGRADNQVIWLFPNPQLALLRGFGEEQAAALSTLSAEVSEQQFDLMRDWLDAIVADPAPLSADKVVAHKPAAAVDACWRVDDGERVNEVATFDDEGVCNDLYPKTPTPRIAAGGPVVDDIIKCQLQPTADFDYGTAVFTVDQQTRLNTVFPEGVCDYSGTGVGQRSVDGTWLDYSEGASGG
ncbi:hypothetical protein SADO_02420 [Salinisphaera dokdonensis CL-ES53]|uniref:DUF6351 domain-containing protein n=1 Tax=Salinisphaera dokdonensis CL-ES53 TaxID=1304272 RepID=A0ABV2AY50_9GAMM